MPFVTPDFYSWGPEASFSDLWGEGKTKKTSKNEAQGVPELTPNGSELIEQILKISKTLILLSKKIVRMK